MISEPDAASSLSRVIVTGGCGLVGSHIVESSLEESSCDWIYHLSRNPAAICKKMSRRIANLLEQNDTNHGIRRRERSRNSEPADKC